MSELANGISNRPDLRKKLLVGVSALTVVYLAQAPACAADDGPTVWIELGGQFERLSNGQERFAPPFVAAVLENPFTPPGSVQAPSSYSVGEEGRVAVRPDGSDWIFSASLRYGRSNKSRSAHDQTAPVNHIGILSVPAFNFHNSGFVPPHAARFADTISQARSTNLVLDFKAGKDVGLGIFGSQGSSNINAGIRFAQFTSQSSASIAANPDFAFSYKYRSTFAGHSAYIHLPQQSWHAYLAKFSGAWSFRGVGPSLEWDASATLVGRPEAGAITFDWGLNAAVLFGRSKARVHHETSGQYRSKANYQSGPPPFTYQSSHDHARSHSIVLPNVGGFAGLSFRFPNAKVSMGYRIDAFFGAMDGGIDARKTYNRDFYGPFASISIGLGG